MRNDLRTEIKALLSPAERAVFKKLNTPIKIQDYLEALPQNFSDRAGDTCRSTRRILSSPSAYCFEGAVLAAAMLAYHGHKPLLLDIQTSNDDVDHVLALFKVDGRWGALSKTNHPVLRYRDPIYKDVRELAMSYFHEYFLKSGKKTMLAYSAPFDLSRYKPETWITSSKSLDWLAEDLDASKHYPVAPRSMLKKLRKATKLEREAGELTEWKPRRKVGVPTKASGNTNSSSLSPF